MSENVKTQAENLAYTRNAKVQFAEQLELAQKNLKVLPEWETVDFLKNQIIEISTVEKADLESLRKAMLKADKLGFDIPDCGTVRNQTIIKIVDEKRFKAWVVEANHLSLLKPILADVKKVAPTLNPDGVEITKARYASVKVNLDAFLPVNN